MPSHPPAKASENLWNQILATSKSNVTSPPVEVWSVTQTATPNTCWTLTMWGRHYIVHSWRVKTINLSYIASEKQFPVSRHRRGDMKITFPYLCCRGSKGCKSLPSSHHYSDGSACCAWRIVTFHQLPTGDAESMEKYFTVFQGLTRPATHAAIASAKAFALPTHMLLVIFPCACNGLVLTPLPDTSLQLPWYAAEPLLK